MKIAWKAANTSIYIVPKFGINIYIGSRLIGNKNNA